MKRKLFYLSVNLALVLFLSVFSSCVFIVGPEEKVTCEEESTETIELEEQKRIILQAKNGGISIVGSDTTTHMHLRVTKRVRSDDLEDAKARLKDIRLTERVDVEEVYIRMEHPSSAKRSYTVNFDIVLPKEFNFEIKAGNGSVSLCSISGSLTWGAGV